MKKVAITLVLIMAVLQGFYAFFAYVDPVSFAIVRGTELVSIQDTDWVRIYASRTMFIALIIGALLLLREYKRLMLCALFGAIMPITDAVLAYQAQAPIAVIVKHLATTGYLLVTAYLLSKFAESKTK